ncbi:MAG TPA: RDD family protein [Bdellovibrionota bacterium]|nr:RDD family protein [Bdellovibrionota bacterium]
MKKADNLHRALAKGIDFLIVGTLCTIPSFVGIVAGAMYILISDGFFRGQSVGKKLIGLRVVVTQGEPKRCSFQDSMIRNLPYGVAIFLGSFPFGWFLFFTVGLFVVAVEAYFVYADDQGVRLGDIFADTQVIDEATTQA